MRTQVQTGKIDGKQVGGAKTCYCHDPVRTTMNLQNQGRQDHDNNWWHD